MIYYFAGLNVCFTFVQFENFTHSVQALILNFISQAVKAFYCNSHICEVEAWTFYVQAQPEQVSKILFLNKNFKKG